MTTEPIEVTQADREAAAGLVAQTCPGADHLMSAILKGEADSLTVRVFARHRQQSEAPLRARIAELEAKLEAAEDERISAYEHGAMAAHLS